MTDTTERVACRDTAIVDRQEERMTIETNTPPIETNRDIIAFDRLVTLLNRDATDGEEVDVGLLLVDILADMRDSDRSFAASCKRMIRAEERDLEAQQHEDERAKTKLVKAAEREAARVANEAAREHAKVAAKEARERDARLAKVAKLREAAAKLEALDTKGGVA